MKVTRRITDVVSLNLRQSLHYSIDSFVGVVLGVAQAFGHKYSYQPGADNFIALTCLVAIGIEPFQLEIKWFLGGGQLFKQVLGVGNR